VRAREAGSGPITMVFGVAIFLGFLLLATQVLVHLYATSTVTAVAFDEARRASTDGGRCEGVDARIRARLGGWAAAPGVEVSCTPGSAGVEPTVVRVRGPSPAQALRIFGTDTVARIDRSASFLTEPEVAP
jgi:hypothetical protein